MPEHWDSRVPPSSEPPFVYHEQSNHSKQSGLPSQTPQPGPSHRSLRSPGPHDLGASLVGGAWQVLLGEAVVGPERTQVGSGEDRPLAAPVAQVDPLSLQIKP